MSKKNILCYVSVCIVIGVICFVCGVGVGIEGSNNNKEPIEVNEIEYQNAVEKAEEYLKLDTMGFSKRNLISLLRDEGYGIEIAECVADNINVDWNKQCLKDAKYYLGLGSISKDTLCGFLENSGFTEEQIQYALKELGY